MKKIILSILLLAGICRLNAGQVTPFLGKFYNSDGSPQTNTFIMSAYPHVNTWTRMGTNLVYGGASIIVTPDATGYFSNSAAGNTYQCLFTNLNSGFYVTLPNSALPVNFPDYITNAPLVAGTLTTGYAIATNLLGFGPATNSPAGIDAALGYSPQPASTTLSNLTAGTTLGLTNNGVIEFHDALGQILRTNTFAHSWLFIDTNQNIFINSQSVLTNPAAFDAAGASLIALMSATNFTRTNLLGPQNMPALGGDMTNAPGTTNVYLVTLLNAGTAMKVTFDNRGRIVSTNALTANDIIIPLGFQPQTNNIIPQIGISNAPPSWLVTNGFQVWLSLQTNGVPGPAWTNLPNGSICTTTNGGRFTLSNSVFWPF